MFDRFQYPAAGSPFRDINALTKTLVSRTIRTGLRNRVIGERLDLFG